MKDLILKLRQEGKTYNEIKELVNCSKGTISYYCGEGQKEKNKINNLRRKQRDRDFINTIKDTLKCKNCNDTRYWVLEFHHLDPTKKENTISNLLKTASRKRVIDEINKCIVLCSNCHRELHHLERINNN